MDTTAKRLKWISRKIRLAASAAIDSCNRIAYFPNGVKELDQDDLTLTEPEVRDALDILKNALQVVDLHEMNQPIFPDRSGDMDPAHNFRTDLMDAAWAYGMLRIDSRWGVDDKPILP